MATASKLRLIFQLLLMISLLLFTGVMAETRNSKIGDWGWGEYLRFMDNFRFTGSEKGSVELKVTNISFFNPNPNHIAIPRESINNTLLSTIGFFLSDKFLTAQMAESCLLNNSQIKYKLYTLDNLQPNTDCFDFIFSGISKPGDYILYFQNCNPLDVDVTMNARSSLYNLRDHTRDYLSSNQSLVTMVYPFLALLQFALACLWALQIPKFKTSKKKKIMCWLFVLVPLLRAWSLIFSMVRNVYIMKIGCSECWFSVLLSFVSGFLNQAPVGIFLVVFSTGLVMVKRSLYVRDKILILLEVFVQLGLVYFNIWYQSGLPFGREVLYLYPGIVTTFSCMTTNAFFHQLTVNVSLNFLREVARGNCPDATLENETPKSLLTFGEVLKSLFSTHAEYYLLQAMIIPLEIFSSRICLIVTLKELAAIVFFVKVACHLRPELWILNLSCKDGTYDDIEKSEPLLLSYDDDLFCNYLEQEWDGVSAGALLNQGGERSPYILEKISYFAFFAGKK